MIKAWALADFIVEFIVKEDGEERPATWIIWTDGSSNQQAGKAGVLLQLPKGDTIECAVCLQFFCLQFSTTNNEAEYEAILSGLDLAKAAGAMSVVIHYNSQVFVRHINGDYKAKGERMREYLSMIKRKMGEGLLANFVQIPREKNKQADRLAKVASTECMVVINHVLFFIQYSPIIDKVEV